MQTDLHPQLKITVAVLRGGFLVGFKEGRRLRAWLILQAHWKKVQSRFRGFILCNESNLLPERQGQTLQSKVFICLSSYCHFLRQNCPWNMNYSLSEPIYPNAWWSSVSKTSKTESITSSDSGTSQAEAAKLSFHHHISVRLNLWVLIQTKLISFIFCLCFSFSPLRLKIPVDPNFVVL